MYSLGVATWWLCNWHKLESQISKLHAYIFPKFRDLILTYQYLHCKWSSSQGKWIINLSNIFRLNFKIFVINPWLQDIWNSIITIQIFLRVTQFLDEYLAYRLRKFSSTHTPNNNNNKTYIYDFPHCCHNKDVKKRNEK